MPIESTSSPLAFGIRFSDAFRYFARFYLVLIPIALIARYQAIFLVGLPIGFAWYAAKHGRVFLTADSLNIQPHRWTFDKSLRTFKLTDVTEAIVEPGFWWIFGSLEVRAGQYFAFLPVGLLTEPRRFVDELATRVDAAHPLLKTLRSLIEARRI